MPVRGEVQKLNLVNSENSSKPSYDLSQKQVYFVIYMSVKGELAIIGELDNNYLVWCSFSNVGDKETNKEIFDFVSNYNFTNYSQLYRVLEKNKYKEIISWYRIMITRSTFEPNICWYTPFGGARYGNDIENHGRYFSGGIITHFNELGLKCKHRINNGLYLPILNSYSEILKNELYEFEKDNNTIHYYNILQLISILREENYLKLSEDLSIQNKYNECLELSDQLYNRYMMISR